MLPADFDYRFYQAAHPRLILPRYLTGDEIVRLDGLLPGGAGVTFRLPRIAPFACFRWSGGSLATARLNCDGLHIDARAQPLRVELTWRGWLPAGKRFSGIELRVAALGEAWLSKLYRLGLRGLDRKEAA